MASISPTTWSAWSCALLHSTPACNVWFSALCSAGSRASPFRAKPPVVFSPSPSTVISSSARAISTTVIWFSVSVPVLSVQMTSVAPRASTAERRLMRALRRAMRRMPRARAMVATMGRPSGTVATAKAMAVSIMSRISLPARMPATATTAAMTRVIHTRRRPS